MSCILVLSSRKYLFSVYVLAHLYVQFCIDFFLKMNRRKFIKVLKSQSEPTGQSCQTDRQFILSNINRFTEKYNEDLMRKGQK